MNLLQHIGSKVKAFFVGANKLVKEGDAIAIKAAPIATVLLPPGISTLFNITANLVGIAEATGDAALAGAAGSNGTAKSATVLASLKPIALELLKAEGIAQPTDDQIAEWIDVVVKGLKIFSVVPVTA